VRHLPWACASFKQKKHDERLVIVQRKELCTFCFRHLDTKQYWSVRKIPACGVNGSDLAHSSLLHDVLDRNEMLMVHASLGEGQEAVQLACCPC
jgi:hypothetical protein